MEYLDPDDNTKYLPYVVEPSVGVERMLLSILFSAYDEETDENGNKRVVLRLKPVVAPYKVAVLPLIKKNHADRAKSIYENYSKYFSTVYDDSANIGKRYRRQDAIGTPFCVTIDDETIQNSTVTVRDRDTMMQKKMLIEDVIPYILEKL